MTILAFFAAWYKTQGIPTTSVGWTVLGIVTIGTVLGWFILSVAIKTTSVAGEVNWIDALKGAGLALSQFLVTWGAAAYTQTTINWGALLASILTVVGGYLIKQLVTPVPKA